MPAQYLPTVAWETIVRDVVVVDATHYYVSVYPENPNDPGSDLLSASVGQYLKDWIGHTYKIVEVNVGGVPLRLRVEDSFLTGVGPQQGLTGIVYQSPSGSPFLAPVRHFRLDESALDYSRAIELDVQWNHRGIYGIGTGIDEVNLTKITLGAGLKFSDLLSTGWNGGKSVTIGVDDHNNLPGLQGIGPDLFHLMYEQYRGVSAGSGGYLPRYNVAGWLENSKFTDDGTTPKYGNNIIEQYKNTVATGITDANIKEVSSIANYQWTNTPYNSIGLLNIDNHYSNDWVNQSFESIGAVPNRWIRSFHSGTTWGNWYKFYHSGNINLSTVDFTCKDLTTVTVKIGTLSGYLKGTLGTVGAVSSIPQADITNLVSDLSNKQPLDGDLTAIAAIATTSGLLRKTATDTWILDTNTYLTAITKSQVEAVLTGTITTHTHNYQPLDTTLTSLAAVSGVQGDLLYASGTDAWTRLVKSTTANSFLKNSGTNNNPAWSVISESDISFTDITTGNVSTLKHGYFPKLPTPTGKYLRDDLTWQTISSGGTPGGSDSYVQFNDSGSFGGVSTFTFNKLTGLFKAGISFKDIPSDGNLFIGYTTRPVTTGLNNVFTGYGTGSSITTGSYNAFYGNSAGVSISGTNRNTFIGNESGYLNTGSNNTFVGGYSGRDNTGDNNTFLGYKAGAYSFGSSRVIIDGVDRTTSALTITDSLIYGVLNSSVSLQELRFNCGYMGFYGTAPIVKPTITGSKGGNAALTSLLTQLSNLGLIVDSTT